MNRRKGVIAAMAAVVGVLYGKRAAAQQTGQLPPADPPQQQTLEYRYSAPSLRIDPKPALLYIALDQTMNGITVEYKGEHITVSPEEIMEALRQ